MDFQKKREGGPPTQLPSLLIVKLFYFFRTAVGVVVVYERRHFFHYFSPTYFYAKAKVILHFFFSILTRRLSVMAQTKEKQHWMHIYPTNFFVDPKKGYGIKDFGYQVFIAFFLVQKRSKSTI